MENKKDQETNTQNESASQKEELVSLKLPEVVSEQLNETQTAETQFENKLVSEGYTETEIKGTEAELGVSNQLQSINAEIQDLSDTLNKTAENKEQKKVPENFLFNVKRLLVSLEKEKSAAERGYVYTLGETREKTSSGKELAINSIVYHYEGSLMSVGEESKQNLVLTAKDVQSGDIVGLRLTTVEDRGSFARDESDNLITNYKASGFIITKNRGEGVATALDKAYEKSLTKIMNKRDNFSEQTYQGQLQHDPSLVGQITRHPDQITWTVENKSLENLLKLKNKLQAAEQYKEEDWVKNLKEEIKEKEMEQERWLALYGDGGKLGMKLKYAGSETLRDQEHYSRPTYEKIIRPNNTDEGTDLDKIDPVKFNETIDDLKKCLE